MDPSAMKHLTSIAKEVHDAPVVSERVDTESLPFRSPSFHQGIGAALRLLATGNTMINTLDEPLEVKIEAMDLFITNAIEASRKGTIASSIAKIPNLAEKVVQRIIPIARKNVRDSVSRETPS